MTSRSLFFRLMREDLKRRIWAVGLAFLSFFFCMPVAAAMGASSIAQTYQRWVAEGVTLNGGMTTPEAERYSRLVELAGQIAGPDNFVLVCIMMGAAIVLGLTGFIYLHSRKQVDFYNSLPVRREVLYFVKYLDGIFIILFMYLLNLLLACGIFLANGIGPSVFLTGSMTAFGVNMVGFLLIYGLTTIAVLMTGNFFISILGGMVLHSILPVIVLTIYSLMSLFFVTFNTRGMDILEKLAINGSPFSYYVSMVSESMRLSLFSVPMQSNAAAAVGMGTVGMKIGIGFLAAVIMVAVGLLLYRLRPSEAAGKAMAFSMTKAPIKILIVTPLTILMGVLFWSIYSSLAWAAFGFLFGLVITHCIVEILYHFDFRKLFQHPAHMGICAVLALAAIGVFRFDLPGYDRYFPSEGDFSSASISCYGLQDWHDYGLPRKDTDGSYTWYYMNEDEYAAGNMKITDYGLMKALAQNGIGNAAREKESRMTGSWYTGQEDGYQVYAEVGYERRDGSKVYRNYNLNLTEIRDVMNQIYESAEYKKGVYPVMNYEPSDVVGVYEAKAGVIQKVEGDGTFTSELLAAYQEELTALSLTERSQTAPLTSLRFLTTGEREYLHAISADRVTGYTGDFRLEDMNQVNFFPVYPSFTKTIGLLKEAGIDVEKKISADEVDRIEIVHDYGDGSFEAADSVISFQDGEVVYQTESASEYDGRNRIIIENDGTDASRQKLQEILDSIAPSDMMELNQLQMYDYGLEVRVFRRDGSGTASYPEETYASYYFDGDRIPQFIKDAVQYDQQGWKNVNYGLSEEFH